MSRFKRVALEQIKKKDSKEVRKKIIIAVRSELEIRYLNQSGNNYMLQIARLLNGEIKTEEDVNTKVEPLVEAFFDTMQGADREPDSKMPMLFYYFLKEHRLSPDDELVADVYMEVVKDYDKTAKPSIKAFRHKGTDLLDRLKTWLAGAGNDPVDVLVDYCNAAFAAVIEWKPSLVHQPGTILGDYGWQSFIDWIQKERGGRVGYLTATKGQLSDAQKRRKDYYALTKLRASLLEQGNVNLYDELGEAAADWPTVLGLCKQHGLNLEAYYA